MSKTASVVASATPLTRFTLTYAQRLRGQTGGQIAFTKDPLFLLKQLLASFPGSNANPPAKVVVPPYIAGTGFGPQLTLTGSDGDKLPQAFKIVKAIVQMRAANATGVYQASPIIGDTELRLIPGGNGSLYALQTSIGLNLDSGFNILGQTRLHADFNQTAWNAWLAAAGMDVNSASSIFASVSMEVEASTPDFNSARTPGYGTTAFTYYVANKGNSTVNMPVSGVSTIVSGPAAADVLSVPFPFPSNFAPWQFSSAATITTTGDLVANLSVDSYTEIMIPGADGGLQILNSPVSSDAVLIPSSLNTLKSIV